MVKKTTTYTSKVKNDDCTPATTTRTATQNNNTNNNTTHVATSAGLRSLYVQPEQPSGASAFRPRANAFPTTNKVSTNNGRQSCWIGMKLNRRQHKYVSRFAIANHGSSDRAKCRLRLFRTWFHHRQRFELC